MLPLAGRHVGRRACQSAQCLLRASQLTTRPTGRYVMDCKPPCPGSKQCSRGGEGGRNPPPPKGTYADKYTCKSSCMESWVPSREHGHLEAFFFFWVPFPFPSVLALFTPTCLASIPLHDACWQHRSCAPLLRESRALARPTHSLTWRSAIQQQPPTGLYFVTL